MLFDGAPPCRPGSPGQQAGEGPAMRLIEMKMELYHIDV